MHTAPRTFTLACLGESVGGRLVSTEVQVSTENPDPEVQVSTENPGPEVQVSTETRVPEVQVSMQVTQVRADQRWSTRRRFTKKKKGSKGLPKGITEHRSKKLQARLSYKGEDGKTIQRFIPGLFEDIDAAVAAQAAAYKVLDNDGPLAVWPPVTKPERKKRGEVRASPSPDLHRVLSA